MLSEFMLTEFSKSERYYVKKHGLYWRVYCGTGTLALFKSLRWRTAALYAEHLKGAFMDGLLVGEHLYSKPTQGGEGKL